MGLLDEEVGQQSPQTAHSEVEETHDTILLDDIGGASCDSEGEDETAPLLDKTAKKQSTDDNSREREKGTKGDNKREGTDKAREERINGGKKEGERIPIRDTDQPEKRDKEVGTKIKEGVPRHTDKPEQDTEKTDKERKAKDIDGESIANDKEEGGLRGGDDLEEEAATKKKKDTQTGTDNPETKDREEMVEEKERGEAKDRKDINQAEAEVKGEKIRDSKGDTSDKAVEKDKGLMEDDPLVVRDTEETIKERKRGGSRDISQTETKDKGERMKEWGKGDNEKALAKGREKVKDTRQTEAETLEGIGIEEIVKERKRGGPARKEEEAATKRKKKEHRDKNTSAIEGRGAEAKDGEDKVKEKKRGGKEKKRRSREKDNP